MTGSVITSSAGFDSGSVAPAFALAKSAAISSALSWRFGSLFVVSATASSAAGLGSTTGSGSGICGVSLTGSGSGTCGVSTTGSGSFTGIGSGICSDSFACTDSGSGIASMAGADCGASIVCLGISTFAVN